MFRDEDAAKNSQKNEGNELSNVPDYLADLEYLNSSYSPSGSFEILNVASPYIPTTSLSAVLAEASEPDAKKRKLLDNNEFHELVSSFSPLNQILEEQPFPELPVVQPSEEHLSEEQFPEELLPVDQLSVDQLKKQLENSRWLNQYLFAQKIVDDGVIKNLSVQLDASNQENEQLKAEINYKNEEGKIMQQIMQPQVKKIIRKQLSNVPKNVPENVPTNVSVNQPMSIPSSLLFQMKPVQRASDFIKEQQAQQKEKEDLSKKVLI